MPANHRPRLRAPLIALSILTLSALIIDQVTLVRPGMPPAREGDPVPAHPAPGDAPYHRTPLAPSFEQRRALYLRWLMEQPAPTDRGGVWTDSARLLAGANEANAAAISDGLDFVNARKDPSDFTLNGLVRLYYLHAGQGKLSGEQEQAIRRAMLDFKYWFDEPNRTDVEMWTENHQILNHSAQYLAGQAFPDEIFTNNGMDGRWHQQAGRERILRWIDWRARTGFAEWDSVVYYPEDLAPLLNLVDFAEDKEVANRAAMMVDAILFDIAVDSFYGQYATAHGRATAGSIKSAAGDSLVTLQALAWGTGRFQTTTNMASIALATTQRYRIPPVIQVIALDNPDSYANYERHSIPLTEEAAEQYGLSFDDPASLPVWWGMGAFTNPEVIDLTIRTADSWNLWHYPDFRDLKDLAKALQSLRLLGPVSALLDPDSNGVLLSEVNKITYRTPDYILSTAQDYRKGQKGYQQHIWQATLSPYAVVFATHPDSLRADDRHRPSYWSSHGRLPRAGQIKNVLVALHNTARHPSPPPLEVRHYAFTHAYFPRWAFDQVIEVPNSNGAGGWIFGKAGSGYVALYSHQYYQWINEGPDAGQEIAAPGRQNVFIIQMGRAAEDGTFDDFVAAVSGAPLQIDGLNLRYQAPGLGELRFGWDRPLTLDGVEVPLRDYPRWHNPYTTVEFGQQVYQIEHQGQWLRLDFEQGTREFSQ